MIELRNIRKEYKIEKQKVQALQEVNLRLPNKGMICILGASGSGKSTLLNIIGGLDSYDSGEMIVDGKSTKNFSSNDSTRYRNSYVGFIFQEFYLIEEYTVYENIHLVAQLQGKRKSKKQVHELLMKLGLEGYENRKIHELSGGEKQRVAIARILIKNSKVICADEPTGSLDNKTGREVMSLLKEISKEVLVVLVTHNREYALEYAERIIEIEDGRIVNDSGKTLENELEIYQEKKAKLPFSEAFKLGKKLLFHHKGKAFLSIFLLFIVSLLLNVVYVMYSYDANTNHLHILKNDKKDRVEIRKTKGNLQTDDVTFLQKTLEKPIGIVYTNQMNPTFLSLFHTEDTLQMENKFSKEENFAEVEFIEVETFPFDETWIGEIPVESNDVVLSTNLADKMIKYGVYDSMGHIQFPKEYENLLNKVYLFGGDTIKITGIIKENEDKIYAKTNFISSLKGQTRIGLNSNNQYIFKLSNLKKMIQNNDLLHEKIEYYDGTTWKMTSTLDENQVILNIVDIFPDKLAYLEQLENDIQNYSFKDFYEAEKHFIEQIDLKKYIHQKGTFSIYEDVEVYIDGQGMKPSKQYDVEVIGVTGFSYFDNQYTLFSKKLLSSYENFTYQKVGILSSIENIDVKKLGENYTIFSPYLSDLNTYSHWLLQYKFLINLFFYLFLTFTGLLFIYFLLTYIMDSKKTIGILKALGVENKDILKMIYVVMGIVIVSFLLLTLFCSHSFFPIINTYYKKTFDSNICPFYMGKDSYYFLFFYYFGLTLFIGIFPILRITKMKPIHTINKTL